VGLAVGETAGTGGVNIYRLQTGGLSSASDEFVELRNSGFEPVSLTGWQMQYQSYSATAPCANSWSKKADLTGSIAADGGYLLATQQHVGFQPAVTYTAGFAAASGAVRVVDNLGLTVDVLSWGAGDCGRGKSAAAPAAGQFLLRRDSTGDNKTDFMVTDEAGLAAAATPTPAPAVTPTPSVTPTATPMATPVSTAAPTPMPPVTPTIIPTVPPDPSPTVTVMATPEPIPPAPVEVELSELMIDPVAPLTDAADEFVEIHNIGQGDAPLAGFQLKTARESYTFGSVVVPTGGYLVVKSADTKLGLTNTGGSLELDAPDGTKLDSTAWGEAPAGQSWAVVDEVWAWTVQATPGEPNVGNTTSTVSASPVTPKPTVTAKPKASVTPKPTVKAVVAVKTPKPSATPKPKTTAKPTATPKPAAGTTKNNSGNGALPSPGLSWLIVALVAITISYVIFEFRHDLVAFYYRFLKPVNRSGVNSGPMKRIIKIGLSLRGSNQ
jgi:outer membrane biosynthesis protein TonB